jgi:hypothetical protein
VNSSEQSAAVRAARVVMERCARRVVGLRQHATISSNALDETGPAMQELRAAIGHYARALREEHVPTDVTVGLVTALVSQLDFPPDERPMLRRLAFQWAAEG